MFLTKKNCCFLTQHQPQLFIFQNASPDVVKILAGNKCECSSAQRAVDKEKGEKVILRADVNAFHKVYRPVLINDRDYN
jgi:hypothetical protein